MTSALSDSGPGILGNLYSVSADTLATTTINTHVLSDPDYSLVV